MKIEKNHQFYVNIRFADLSNTENVCFSILYILHLHDKLRRQYFQIKNMYFK